MLNQKLVKINKNHKKWLLEKLSLMAKTKCRNKNQLLKNNYKDYFRNNNNRNNSRNYNKNNNSRKKILSKII